MVLSSSSVNGIVSRRPRTRPPADERACPTGAARPGASAPHGATDPAAKSRTSNSRRRRRTRPRRVPERPDLDATPGRTARTVSVPTRFGTERGAARDGKADTRPTTHLRYSRPRRASNSPPSLDRTPLLSKNPPSRWASTPRREGSPNDGWRSPIRPPTVTSHVPGQRRRRRPRRRAVTT